MEGPSTVRLQRRRGELPPDQLIVERRGGKRKEHPSIEDAARGHYVRQKRETSISGIPSDHLESAGNSAGNNFSTASATSFVEARRTFHLKQPSLLPPSAEGSKSRKRKQNDALLPTVFEKRQRKFEDDTPTHHFDNEPQTSTPSAPPKRPGRGSALRPQAPKPAATKPDDKNVAARQQREVQALAAEMHQFALEELAKTPKPQVKTKPKLTPSRSRALHEKQQSPVSPRRGDQNNNKDHDDDTAMDSDSEYVYDTYVLAPVPQPATSNPLSADNPVETTKSLAIPSNVGYLIITEDDEQLWETYMHDLEGSDSEPTDEDDENAEDYYGADYPSDELASDDEFDRGGAAYGYRARRGSNDEQYNLNDADDDEDEITWSDEEDMRMMNPFAKKSAGAGTRVERQFAKYLDRKRAAEEE